MNLASIDLNLLVALDALLNERHVTRAGERLGLTQPTMSHTLERLRRLFGDELVIRVGWEYELTPLADELREPLRDILERIERTIERRPSFGPIADERAFTFAASDYSTFLVLQPALRRLQDDAPNVSLEVHPIQQARSAVANGELELAIWPAETFPKSNLPNQVLFTDRWVALAWAGNEEVHGVLSLDQALAVPHVAFGRSLHRVDQADRDLLQDHPDMRIAMTVESFFLLSFMLAGTGYIAFVQEGMARRLAASGEIKVLDLDFETRPVPMAMFWHPRPDDGPSPCVVARLARPVRKLVRGGRGRAGLSCVLGRMADGDPKDCRRACLRPSRDPPTASPQPRLALLPGRWPSCRSNG